jgi:3-keto-disaccharide hydrolase
MRQIALFLAVLLSGCSGGGGTPIGGSGGASGSGGNDPGGSGGSVTGGSGGAAGSGGSGGAGGSGGSAGAGGSAGTSDAGGSAGSGGAYADAGTSDASAGDGPVANPGPSQFPIPPGMTPIFDGKTLNGWSGNPAIWSVDAETMSIHGKTGGPGGQLIKSAGDYDDFRLVVTERAVATTNHMGICFWGSRPGFGYGGCIDVIPPSGSMWDYGGGGQVPNQGVGSANNPIKFMWHQVEILATGSTGEILVAVNGKQTSNYKKAGRGRKGPIGFQAHAGASDQEYKDVYVEVAPKEHRLLTLKP